MVRRRSRDGGLVALLILSTTCILVTALLSCRLDRKVLSFSRFQSVFCDGIFLSKMRLAFRGGDGTFLILTVILTACYDGNQSNLSVTALS